MNLKTSVWGNIAAGFVFLALPCPAMEFTESMPAQEVPVSPVNALCAHRLRFEYSTSGEINRQSREILTLTVRFLGDEKQMTDSEEPAEKVFRFAPSDGKRHIEIGEDKLLSPRGCTGAKIMFRLEGKGSATLSAPEWEEIPLPRDMIRAGGRLWRRIGRKTDPVTGFTREERERGFLLYQREPSRVFPESIPQRHEIRKDIRKFTVPGEYCNLSFVCHFLRKDEIKDVTFGDLRTSDGKHSIPGSVWSVFEVFFRKKPAWNTRNYFIVPENLYPFAPHPAEEGSNSFLWFQCRLPDDTVPGIYSGTVRIVGGNTEQNIPVFLRVLPFRLKTPPVDWIMYGGGFYAGGWVNRNREDIQQKYFDEIASLGFTGLAHHGGLYTEKNAEMLCRRLDKAGMHGPLIIDFGWQLESHICREITGAPVADHKKFPFPECADRRIAEGFIRHLSSLNSWMKKYFKGTGWYYQGLDEPHIYGGLSQAAWEYPLAKQAGVKTSSTVYPLREFTEFGKWKLDLSINAQVKFTEKGFRDLKTAAERQHTALWLLGPGSYNMGTGIPNRYQSGFLFFRTKLPGCVAWTYGAGPDINELETAKMNSYVVYARKDFQKKTPVENPVVRVCTSSILAEGLREGIMDYKYAYTLAELVREAKEKNIPAGSAESFLKQLESDMIPFWSEININGIMDEPAMERIRWAASQEILTLMKELHR